MQNSAVVPVIFSDASRMFGYIIMSGPIMKSRYGLSNDCLNFTLFFSVSKRNACSDIITRSFVPIVRNSFCYLVQSSFSFVDLDHHAYGRALSNMSIEALVAGGVFSCLELIVCAHDIWR